MPTTPSNPTQLPELSSLPFFAPTAPDTTTDPSTPAPRCPRPTPVEQATTLSAAPRRRGGFPIPASVTAALTPHASTTQAPALPSPQPAALSQAHDPGADQLEEPGPDDTAFWSTIARLRSQAVSLLTDSVDPALSEAAREEAGRSVIALVVREHVEEQLRAGGERTVWGPSAVARAQQAVFNQMFRLGRYQELLDDPQVENIHIHGHDQVFVALTGGRMEARAPVANSDEELMQDLQFFATRDGENARPFSTTHPDLDLDLLGYVRLAAVATPIAERPSAVLRVHRYINITLEQLVKLGMLTEQAARFLTTAVEAKRSIVICGFGGTGKTTLMRALAAKIGPMEQIVTVEKERELHLKNLADRVVPPFALQYRPGSGERDAHGNFPGEYTLERCMEKALRLNAERIMVGEVRGAEIVSMIQAMQVGAGTFCTTHAYSPNDCIDRLAGLGIGRYGAEYMKIQLGQHLDFIVQLDRIEIDGKLIRKLTHICEVQAGEGARAVSTTDLFRLDPGDDHARFLRPPSAPQLLQAMTRAGLEHGEEHSDRGSGR